MFFVGVIIGDIFILIFDFTFQFALFWLLIAIFAVLVAVFCPCLATLPLAFAAGILLIQFRAMPELASRHHLRHFYGKNIIISGIISADPGTNESGTAIKLGNLKVRSTPLAGTILVKLPRQAKLARADNLILEGQFRPSSGSYFGSISRPRILKTYRPSPRNPLLTLRDHFATNIRKFIPAPAVDLGLGYLLGMRSGLPSDLDDSLRVVGLTHIIVASGTHLSILIGFVRQIFGRLSRFASLFFSLLFIGSFFVMIGPTPSILRASLVSAFSLLAWFVGRKFQPLRIIILVAALTILINPFLPLSLGWLLSLAAFSGILLLNPILVRFFYGTSSPGVLGSTFLATVSAGLFCNPITLFYFGSFSFLSFIANLLILPTISYTIALIFLTGFCSFIPPLAQLIAIASTFLLNFHISVVRFLGAKTSFLLQIEPGNPLVFLSFLPVVGIYLCSLWYNLRHENKVATQDSTYDLI